MPQVIDSYGTPFCHGIKTEGSKRLRFCSFEELLENLICNNGFPDINSHNQDSIIRFPIMSIRLDNRR